MMSKFRDKFLRKIKCSKGETITETLVSLLIIVLAMTMLAGSIVTASSVNKKVKDVDTSFKTVVKDESTGVDKDNTIPSTGQATVRYGSNSENVSIDIKTTDDNNSYVFYKESTD